LYLSGTNSANNIFNNVTLRQTTQPNINFATAYMNGTKLIDMHYIGNYSFTGAGGIITVENTMFGEIRFLDLVNGTGTNLTSDIRIGNNSVFVNSSSNSGLNKSANVTLYGIGDRGFSYPAIFKDGEFCSECYNFTSLTADTIIFNVSSWSNYSIGNNPPSESLSSEDTSGSSGGGGNPTFRPNENQLNGGYNKIMWKNWRISFEVNNETHTFKIENISETDVKVSISSETQEATLLIGEERKFDVSGDNYYDVLVKLNSIDYINKFSPKADITIRIINEEILGEMELSPTITGDAVGDLESKGKGWIVLIIVLVLVGIAGFYSYKKRRHWKRLHRYI